MESINKHSYNPQDMVTSAGIAQKIKPEGFPDVVVSKDIWNNTKTELEKMLKNGFDESFFELANYARDVKVEE